LTKENEDQEQIVQPDSSVSVFGYELIRDVLLGDILGNDAADILYWGGKSLARRFPCADADELSAFFIEAGWGQIELVKENKKETIYRLSGGLTERRFDVQTDPAFTLESGFLAEQIAARFDAPAEAICHLNKRGKHVDITVKWE
jgi:predicted hydrocarbon binding protein